MQKEEEIKAINIQIVALMIVIISTIISILITYNQKLNLEKKETIFNTKQSFNITLFNRVLITVLSIVFLYVNIKLYNLSKKQGEDLKSYILQIIASILAIISAVIALYVVKLSTNESIVDVENPVI